MKTYQELALGEISRWIFTPELQDLVLAFGGAAYEGKTIKATLEELTEFSKHWDFRKGVERTAIPQIEFSETQIQKIQTAAQTLDLLGNKPPSLPSYGAFVVLGGTLLSCYLRTHYAAHLRKLGIATQRIYLLGTKRIPSQIEINAIQDVGITEQTASNEFEMLCQVAEKEFGVSLSEESPLLPDTNSFVRRYKGNDDLEIAVLCTAGKQDPNRATTGDTYEHLMSLREIPTDATALIITNQIYVPFQQFDAIRLIQCTEGIKIETVGYILDDTVGTPTTLLLQPQTYLRLVSKICGSFAAREACRAHGTRRFQ